MLEVPYQDPQNIANKKKMSCVMRKVYFSANPGKCQILTLDMVNKDATPSSNFQPIRELDLACL